MAKHKSRVLSFSENGSAEIKFRRARNFVQSRIATPPLSEIPQLDRHVACALLAADCAAHFLFKLAGGSGPSLTDLIKCFATLHECCREFKNPHTVFPFLEHGDKIDCGPLGALPAALAITALYGKTYHAMKSTISKSLELKVFLPEPNWKRLQIDNAWVKRASAKITACLHINPGSWFTQNTYNGIRSSFLKAAERSRAKYEEMRQLKWFTLYEFRHDLHRVWAREFRGDVQVLVSRLRSIVRRLEICDVAADDDRIYENALDWLIVHEGLKCDVAQSMPIKSVLDRLEKSVLTRTRTADRKDLGDLGDGEIAVLDEIRRAGRPIKAAEIKARLNVHIGTVQRNCRSLKARNLIKNMNPGYLAISNDSEPTTALERDCGPTGR